MSNSPGAVPGHAPRPAIGAVGVEDDDPAVAVAVGDVDRAVGRDRDVGRLVERRSSVPATSAVPSSMRISPSSVVLSTRWRPASVSHRRAVGHQAHAVRQAEAQVPRAQVACRRDRGRRSARSPGRAGRRRPSRPAPRSRPRRARTRRPAAARRRRTASWPGSAGRPPGWGVQAVAARSMVIPVPLRSASRHAGGRPAGGRSLDRIEHRGRPPALLAGHQRVVALDDRARPGPRADGRRPAGERGPRRRAGRTAPARRRGCQPSPWPSRTLAYGSSSMIPVDPTIRHGHDGWMPGGGNS